MLWPTPMSGDGKHGGPNQRDSSGKLALAGAAYHNATMWPTPAAQDSKNSTLPPSQVERDTIPGEMIRRGEADGQLNPDFVECLMNLPIGWTDPDCDEPQPWPGVPAGPGELQHEWEPSRLAKGVKHRRERLQAIGNAVYPDQARPIFRAIMEIEARETK